MARPLRDQAEGLRRLVGRGNPRVIALASCGTGMGKTTLAVNLAAAIAQRGGEVVIVDENRDGGSVSESLGLRARYDLSQALQGERTLEQVLVAGPPGISIVPAARNAKAGRAASPGNRAAFADWGRLLGRTDLVLVDCAHGEVGRSDVPELAGGEVIIATSASAHAITRTYAWIKQLASRDGDMDLRIAVCRSHSEEQARTVYENLARVSRSRLGLRLQFLGHFCHDDGVRRAFEMRCSLLEACPLSMAAAQIRDLAGRLGTLRPFAAARTDARKSACLSPFGVRATAAA